MSRKRAKYLVDLAKKEKNTLKSFDKNGEIPFHTFERESSPLPAEHDYFIVSSASRDIDNYKNDVVLQDINFNDLGAPKTPFNMYSPNVLTSTQKPSPLTLTPPIIEVLFSVVKANKTLLNVAKYKDLKYYCDNNIIPEKYHTFYRNLLTTEYDETKSHDIIERLICHSRGSLEATKIKIDRLLTTRGLLPQIVANRSVEEFEDFLQKFACIPLPKMDKEQTRVFIVKHLKEDWADFDMLTCMRYCFLLTEYRINFDYSLKDIYIIDFKFVSMNDITKLNPVVLRDADILARTVYGLRIKSIHIINAPSYVDLFVSIYKKMVSAKQASRIYTHISYDTIYDYVSKEILPEDYSGDGPSVAKLHEQWKKYLESDEGRKIIETSNNLKSDESRRNCAKFNEEYMGMPGSFTKLNVD